MKIETQEARLCIRLVGDLQAHSAGEFLDAACKALPKRVDTVEIDLSETTMLDSCGVGTLIRLYTRVASRNSNVEFRITNPSPPVRHLLELTRMHRLFQITPSAQTNGDRRQ